MAFHETNGRRVGTRITLVNVNKGEYLTMELPIVFEATVYWAAHAAKKALNMLEPDEPTPWFIERYDAIMKED